MTRLPLHALIVCTFAVAGCSVGPRFEAALPQVRDVPVVANLPPSEALVRGRSFLGARQYGLAIELFKNARRDPALRTDSLNGLAVAYDAIGRRDIAERYFEEALASQPADERTRRNLARFYAATGQTEKQRAILSEAPEFAMAATDDSASIEPKPAAHDGNSVSPTRTTLSIEQQSPLSPLLPPMRVRASLPMPGASTRMAPAPDGKPEDVVECRVDHAEDDGNTPAGMRMLRLNIGEVFITAEPSGTTCRAGTVGNQTSVEPETSNGEYLGRIAAYLDRINRQAAAEEIAAVWLAAFWPHRGA